MIHLEFDTQNRREVHAHQNYELIYVIEGSCAVTVEDTVKQLEQGDFLVISSLQKHGYHVGGGVKI